MDYLNKIVGYLKDINEFYPRNVTKSATVKISPGTLPQNLYSGFGMEEYIFFGMVIILFMALFVKQYDNYRHFKVASNEMRRDVTRDVRQLLEEKFSEEFFEHFLRRMSQQGIPNQLDQSTEINMSMLANSPTPTPRTTTPRTSRIPVPTPQRRSNSDISPSSKKSDRGDPGTAVRNSMGAPAVQLRGIWEW